MLKKIYKLNSTQIKELFIKYNKNIKIIRNDYFELKIVKNNSPYSKFGIVLSKKIAKKAVIRNKTRRRFYSIIEDLYKKESFLLENNLYILIYIKEKSIDTQFSLLKEIMYNTILNIKI